MASYVLQNDINVRATRMRAGKVVTDAQYKISELIAAGALLVPSGNAGVASRADELRQESRSGQGMQFDVASQVDQVGPFLPAGAAAPITATRGPVTVATDTVDGMGTPDNEVVWNYAGGVGVETAPTAVAGREFTITNANAVNAVTVQQSGAEHFHSVAGATTSVSVPPQNSMTFRNVAGDWYVI
jgi:hypothetical protein